jgi:hypothetical protein
VLAIVGNATGIHQNPVFQTDAEVWGFGGRGPTLPRLNVLFQLHQPLAWEETPFVEEWLKSNTTIPVYMRKAYPQFSRSLAFPFEEVYRLTQHIRHRGEPLKYFTSSPAYAIALAILQEYPRIKVCGLDLIDDEYVSQKDCLTFWQGFAAGRGIDLDIECMDNVYVRRQYGAQREP